MIDAVEVDGGAGGGKEAIRRPRPHQSLPARPIGALTSIVGLLACFLLVAAVPGATAAAATCRGKKATIVSNAPRIVGTKAPDVIVSRGADNVIHGKGGNDVICSGGGEDTIHGERGNDVIDGETGNDVIDGGRGSDELEGFSGEDRLSGGTGNDTLNGGPGDHDRVFGGPGDDSLSGGAGDFDVVTGGAGNDTLIGAGGAPYQLDGGPGSHDVASFKGAGGPVTIDLEAGVVSGAENENLSGIEDAIGGSSADRLVGSRGTTNRLDGGPGNDQLLGVGPGDEAFGGPGSDSCAGFAAETSCGITPGEAGTGVEIYTSIDNSTSLIVTGDEGADNVTVGFGGGAYFVRGEPGGNVVSLGDPSSGACTRDPVTNTVFCQGAISSILAAMEGGDDTFAVDESVPANVSALVDGGKGSDTLRGGRGNDMIYAGNDHVPDTVQGGGGDDVIFGLNILHPRRDSGPARMFGGPNDDLLIGGQPCDGDLFDGGHGANDSASFARVRNSGIFVKATIGGAVFDPNLANCNSGRITHSVEKIEGSTGPDILIGDNGPNTLLGRGGNDRLDGRGGYDSCVGGGGRNVATNCELKASIP